MDADPGEEAFYYHWLLRAGGIPSHPIELQRSIIESPGRFRHGLSFWQDEPDDWAVFQRQAEDWDEFRELQLKMRVDWKTFRRYWAKVIRRVQNDDSMPDFQLEALLPQRNPAQQDSYTTWVEYLSRELMDNERHKDTMRKYENVYSTALDELLESGVLEPEDRHAGGIEALCRQSILRSTWNDYVGFATSKTAAAQWKQYRINRFKKATKLFRGAQKALVRNEGHLVWIYEQLDDLKKRTRPPDRTFPQFTRLPPEIRSIIWNMCLTVEPRAHFFETLNHERKPHMRNWSTKEFRLGPFPNIRLSGYWDVLSMARACQEARHAVSRYYSSASSTALIEMGWIRPEDLIVLSLPPRQAALWHTHALSFSQGPPRHVGIMLPVEILLMEDDPWEHPEVRLSLIPELLESFRRIKDGKLEGGVKALYVIIEGLHRDADSKAWVFDKDLLDVTGITELRLSELGNALPRLAWSKGAAYGEKLELMRAGDCLQSDLEPSLLSIISNLLRECQNRSWPEFTGVGILGG